MLIASIIRDARLPLRVFAALVPWILAAGALAQVPDLDEVRRELHGTPVVLRSWAVPKILALGPAAAPLTEDLLARLMDDEIVRGHPTSPPSPRLAKGPEDLLDVVFDHAGSFGLDYAEALIAIGPAAVRPLTEFLRKPDLPESACRYAAYALGRIGDDSLEVASVLQAQAERRSDLASIWAAVALARSSSDRFARAMVVRLSERARTDASPFLRMSAVLGLRDIGAPAHAELGRLHQHLRDQSVLVRLATATVLESLDRNGSAQRTVPVLRRDLLLWIEDREIGSRILDLLFAYATVHPPALAAVVDVAVSDDAEMKLHRGVVTQELRRMGWWVLPVITQKIANARSITAQRRLERLLLDVVRAGRR